MPDYTEYIVKQGDRLDRIASEAYGDLSVTLPNGLDGMGSIIDANPDVTIDVYLEVGTRLFIPVFEDGNVGNADLPLWMR